MEPVQGKDVTIFFNEGGWKEFGCAETISLERTSDLVEISTIGQGNHKKFDYNAFQYTINITGLILNDDPKVKVWDLWAYQSNMLSIPYRMVFTDPDATIKAVVGIVIINSINLSGSQEDLASSTIQLQGSGDTLLLDTIDEVELEIQAFAIGSGAVAAIENVILTDALGIETNVLVGPQGAGAATTVQIPSGVYHIRATLSGNQAYNLLQSDAAPGFSENLGGPLSGYEFWPYPPNSPVWDFTVNRFLRFYTSDVPIA